MKTRLIPAAAVAAAAVVSIAAGAVADDKAKTHPEPAALAAMMKSSWSKVQPDEWKTRLETDEVQALCNLYRNAPPPDVAAKIQAAAAAGVVYPADGKVVGDWKKGLALANNGRGGQFSDGPDTVNGGNCYACHQMDPKEVSFGTLGPSLTGYGKAKGYAAAAARDAYAKIYNSHTTLACSNMPRFGPSKFLSEAQIKDAVAALFDPESPVNK
ncbi:sulfur oxidation c-type cytochrome SoxX [Prosthecomicrobium sp. N25]|uniref:sulfur oxidation c-type cytochrome SoxX n=1 Tax=Prosthecomicrobium sp. N25 TaxID=3129254 RepID=UPI00307820BC